MEMKSLHTNIPNREGIKAVKETVNAQAHKPIAIKVIIKFLFLILTVQNLIFKNISQLQIKD